MATEEELAPPIGYFNFADSYWIAARSLNQLNLRTTHYLAPIYFLYHQAIELYLKSFLRLHDHKVEEIKGHKIVPLSRKTQKLGLVISDEACDIFSRLDSADVVIAARYLRVGFTTRPSIEGLERTCESVRALVGAEMKKTGLPIRPVAKTAMKK